MKRYLIRIPTLLPGIWVMVTNAVGNQYLSDQFVVYQFSHPSNEILEWHGIKESMQAAIQLAQEVACGIENFVSALPAPGQW